MSRVWGRRDADAIVDGPDDEDDRPVDPPDGMDWENERTR